MLFLVKNNISWARSALLHGAILHIAYWTKFANLQFANSERLPTSATMLWWQFFLKIRQNQNDNKNTNLYLNFVAGVEHFPPLDLHLLHRSPEIQSSEALSSPSSIVTIFIKPCLQELSNMSSSLLHLKCDLISYIAAIFFQNLLIVIPFSASLTFNNLYVALVSSHNCGFEIFWRQVWYFAWRKVESVVRMIDQKWRTSNCVADLSGL